MSDSTSHECSFWSGLRLCPQNTETCRLGFGRFGTLTCTTILVRVRVFSRPDVRASSTCRSRHVPISQFYLSAITSVTHPFSPAADVGLRTRSFGAVRFHYPGHDARTGSRYSCSFSARVMTWVKTLVLQLSEGCMCFAICDLKYVTSCLVLQPVPKSAKNHRVDHELQDLFQNFSS